MKSTVLVLSDSLGETARALAHAASAQFEPADVRIDRLPNVRRSGEVENAVRARIEAGEGIAVLYTVVDKLLRDEISSLLMRLGIPSVDVLGPVLAALGEMTGLEPRGVPGAIHRTDEGYFKRIEAMEYFVEHDDGRGSDDLSGADIVLIGISRTGKTPLSMYLAHQGYRVANIPLATGVEPPASLFEVDPAKVFGLISTAGVVSSIRNSRLGDNLSRAVAGSYADPELVAREMDDARALIKRLGCLSIRTDGKAIEESAAEIALHLERVAAGRAHRKNMLGHKTN